MIEKHFIKLTDEFCGSHKLIERLSQTAYQAMENMCPDGCDDLNHFCSGLISKDDAEMVMTYVFGKHLDEIRSFYGYDIDLYNFLNRTVHED